MGLSGGPMVNTICQGRVCVCVIPGWGTKILLILEVLKTVQLGKRKAMTDWAGKNSKESNAFLFAERLIRQL